MVDINKEESFIRGLILVANSDIGPDLVANLSPIDDGNALVTALHMVSLAGLEDGNQVDDDSSKMIGPLPVKGSSDYKALYYSEMLKASGAQDERLKKYGAKVGIILVFDKDKLPEIRRASGLIEPYLARYLERVTETEELDKQFALDLYQHVIDLISKPRIRTFRLTEDGMHENNDPGYISIGTSLMILDESEKKMYLLVEKDLSVFIIRKYRNFIDKANLEFYQGSFNVVKLESFSEIEPLLLKHGIQVR